MLYRRKIIKKFYYIYSRVYYVEILNDGYEYYVWSIILNGKSKIWNNVYYNKHVKYNNIPYTDFFQNLNGSASIF